MLGIILDFGSVSSVSTIGRVIFSVSSAKFRANISFIKIPGAGAVNKISGIHSLSFPLISTNVLVWYGIFSQFKPTRRIPCEQRFLWLPKVNGNPLNL